MVKENTEFTSACFTHSEFSLRVVCLLYSQG